MPHALQIQRFDHDLRAATLSCFVALSPANSKGLLDPCAAAMQIAPRQYVVKHAHASEQRDVLKRARNATMRRVMRTHATALRAIETQGALLRPVDAVDHVEQRTLACAVRADQCADLALMGVEGDISDGLHTAER